MKAGQRVRVTWDGKLGTIISLDNRDAVLRMDEPDEDGVTEYRESLSEIEALREPSPPDFNGGFGIGGLGRFEEAPCVPTAEQVRREGARVAKLRRCHRCGALEGDAMFTTDPERRVCDDCFE